MSTIRLKLTIWWPKQGSVIEKVQPDRARIIFLKKDKTCPKWFLQSIFFILFTTTAKVEPDNQKWAQFDWNWQFGDQNNVRWSKRLSWSSADTFFEKEINFVQSGLLSPFFILSTTIAKVEPVNQKWAQFDWNWQFGDQNKVRWSKMLSLIERG